MNMPSRRCCARFTCTSSVASSSDRNASSAPDAEARVAASTATGRRARPFDASRSRPTLSISSTTRISSGVRPAARSSSRRRSNSFANGDFVQRVAWPTPDVSKAVSAQASASRWYTSPMAPVATASSVKRYAVPIRTPNAMPRSTSGAAERPDHRRGKRVVDAPGEEHLHLVEVREARPGQHVERALPEDEAGARPHVTSALAPLQHELPRAGLQEGGEQAGRRHVQERRDAVRLEVPGLRGTSAGDDRETGPCLADDVELLLAQLGGTKPRSPTPHGRSPICARTVSRSVRTASPRRRASARNGQRAVLRDHAAEGRPVAHARHRPLHDGIPRTEPACRGRVGGQGILLERSGHVMGAGDAKRVEDARDRPVPLGQVPRERDPVTERQRTAPEPLAPHRLGPHRLGPLPEGPERREHVAAVPIGLREQREALAVRAAEDAQPVLAGSVAVGLGPVEPLETAALWPRQGGLAGEPELLREHDPARAGDDRGRRRVGAPAALHPPGDVESAVKGLEQQEGGPAPGDTARLAASKDHSVVAGRLRRQGLLDAHRLEQHALGARPPLGEASRQGRGPAGSRIRDQQPGDAGGQDRGRRSRRARRSTPGAPPDAPVRPVAGVAREGRQCRVASRGDVGQPAEVEQPHVPRPRRGDGDRRIAVMRGGARQDHGVHEGRAASVPRGAPSRRRSAC